MDPLDIYQNLYVFIKFALIVYLSQILVYTNLLFSLSISFIHSFSPSFYHHHHLLLLLHIFVLFLFSYVHLEEPGGLLGVEPEAGWIQICGVFQAIE